MYLIILTYWEMKIIVNMSDENIGLSVLVYYVRADAEIMQTDEGSSTL